jgi:TonB family protein
MRALLTAGGIIGLYLVANPILLCISAAPAAAQAQIQATASTAPTPTGNPHACGTEWYPSAALAAGEQGTTTLAFRIGVDGVPNNISIASSSRFADLDDAAEKCVAIWKYQPAAIDGKPVEVDWKATVEWTMPPPKTVTFSIDKHPPPNPPPPQQPIGSQVCMNPMKPPAPLGKVSRVWFWLLADGSIMHLKLFRSSGDDKLDDLAMECASLWRYTPLVGGSARHVSLMIVPIPW